MKRTLRKITAFMSAAAMMAQLSFTGVVFAEDSSQNATKFVFSDDEITVTVGDYSGYKISGTALTINASSTYEVSGSCTDGSIKVKKGTEGVNIILDGLTLASSDTAPLCFNKSSEVTLTANENTVNTFYDTEKNNDDTYADNENAENAVIKCKDGSDVRINGSGTINITANGKNGIKSGAATEEEGDAFLTIDGVTLNITAPVNDAINAENLLTVKSGTLNISAADDALHSDYKLVIGTKDNTKRSKIRTVDFCDTLAEILKEAKKEQHLNRFKYGELYSLNYCKEVQEKGRSYYELYTLGMTEEVPEDYKELSFICLRPDGTYESANTVSLMCRTAQEKVPGLEDFHFHTLRHTFTSNLLSNGTQPKDVQELLGHADVSTTMNIYAHATKEAKRSSARLLDKVVGK